MKNKHLNIKQIAKLFGVSYQNVWMMIKKLNVNYRFIGFKKKEYDLNDFIEKLKKNNPIFYEYNKEKLESLLKQKD